MAKILTTAIVADIRNKLNGSVFSKNRYGAYVRTKVTPVNPQSTAQQNVRNRLATNSQAWRGLTESQRQGWIDAAVNFPFTDIFGNSKVLSGNALYVKLNNNLAIFNGGPIATAPLPVSLPALTIDTLAGDVSSTSLGFNYDPDPVETDTQMVIEATPQYSPGISFVKNKFRTLTTLNAATASPADIYSAYIAAFGPLVAGMKISVRVKLISTITGQAGIPVALNCIVTA